MGIDGIQGIAAPVAAGARSFVRPQRFSGAGAFSTAQGQARAAGGRARRGPGGRR
jgi:hypothetical protein